jgi:hypothetical protein
MNGTNISLLEASKLKKTLKTEQDVYKQYGGDLPTDVYHSKLVPIEPLLSMITMFYQRAVMSIEL